MANDYNEITNRLHSTREAADVSVNHIVSGADEVYDDVAPYRINGHIECNAVTPIGTENPKELKWYEQVTYGSGQDITTEWVRSNDITVDSGKTYGIPTGAKQSDVNDQLYTMVGDITAVTITPSGEVVSSDENKIIEQEDGYIPTAGAVGRSLGANFEDNLTSTSTVKGLTANQGRVLNEKKADKNGWYEQFVAGASLSVIGDDTDDKAKFFYRETGDSEDTGGTKHTIEKGTATIDKIEGTTVKWNQQVQNGGFRDGTTNWTAYNSNNISIASGDNCLVATVEGPGGVGYNYGVRQNINGDYTHLYYVEFMVTIKVGSANKFSFEWLNASNSYLVDCPVDTPVRYVRNHRGTSNSSAFIIKPTVALAYKDKYEVTGVKVTDLTAIFGTDAEIANALGISVSNLTNAIGSSAAQNWITLNPGYQDYYPFNTGSLVSLKPKKLISTEVNLYNPTTETARVLSGKQYKLTGTNTGAAYSDGTAITLSDSLFTASKDDTITISGGNSTSTFLYLVLNNDTSKTFEPYKTNETDLSWIMDIPDPTDNTKKLFPYGLLQAGSVKDEVYPDRVVKRVGVVDLGDLKWSLWGNENSNFSAVKSDVKTAPTSSNVANGICVKYPIASWALFADKSVCLFSAGHGYINLRDSSLSSTDIDAQGKIAKLNGVMLYYELQTPITVTFDELNTHPMNYEVAPGGTEEFVKADAAQGENEPTSTSLTTTITYPMDTLQTIRNLETNLATLKSNYRTTIGNLASTLSTALGGTFTATESTEGSGLYTFSYTAPASGFLAAGNGANGTWSVDNNTMLLTPVSNSNSSENESI